MSSSSGLGAGAAVTALGSSAMPQIRHAPGPVSTTSGSIGQTHSAARLGTGGRAGAGTGAGAVIADARGPAFSQWSGSFAKRSRQPGPQKK